MRTFDTIAPEKRWRVMIYRPQYLERLCRWKDRDVVKVVTGVRRCGKSTLLKLFVDKLLASGVSQACIVTINLEQLENEHLLDYHALHEEVLARFAPKGTTYVFIDEVQNVPDFQKAIDSLYTRGNIDMYITGWRKEQKHHLIPWLSIFRAWQAATFSIRSTATMCEANGY